MKCIRLLLIAVLVGQTAVADERAVNLKWEDVGTLVTGKSVSIRSTDGVKHKGRVRAVEADAIVLDGVKVSRTNVTEIRVVDYVGNGRHRGKFIGGALGLTLGLGIGAAIGLREDSQHKDRDRVLAATLMLGGFPAGLAAGYFLGRQADKEVTVVRIIPQ